ncbi:MAG: enoyl-CoA hydratase-related protein [Rhodocyclaceae bacterium]|nr:enoyl-CoA hydratase-related protein [Rhodocyclaceae bacterium]MDZ4215971.1 enoyl-CoA hydratase-related protein [Rhodocyclaceae bacterium]
MTPEPILTEIDAGIGIVTFNRPAHYNAYDGAMLAELSAAIGRMGEDATVRVVVISSVGESFCAGADQSAQAIEAVALADLLDGMVACPKPLIARVQGVVCGGGVGIVAACDLAVATFDARFSARDPNSGQVPAVITMPVREAMGLRHARRYLLTGETLSAAEAYRIGLIHEMVADTAALDEAIGEWIDALLAQEAETVAACKERCRGHR